MAAGPIPRSSTPWHHGRSLRPCVTSSHSCAFSISSGIISLCLHLWRPRWQTSQAARANSVTNGLTSAPKASRPSNPCCRTQSRCGRWTTGVRYMWQLMHRFMDWVALSTS
eukprot:Lithocolla_globosa_v1_NODE_2099_length_2170_cov_3.224113.p4 type:complete len:111 gc:universal NODE_2099_length_2170_cov_3.224113:381-713(+)